MSASDFIKQLNNIKKEVKVSPDWKSSQREVLLSKISSQSIAGQNNLFTKMFHIHTKLAFKPMVFAMIVMVFFGGIIASVSASGSLPGEILYPIKLTTEKIQVSLVRDQDKRADLQLKLAKKRIEEIKVVANNQNLSNKKTEILKSPIDEYKKSMEEVNKTVLEKTVDDKESASKLAKNLKDTANEVKVAIASASKESNSGEVKDILADVTATTKKVELDAVVSIAKTVDTEAEAKQTLVDYIDSIENDVDITLDVPVDEAKLSIEIDNKDEQLSLEVKTDEIELTTENTATSVVTDIDLVKSESNDDEVTLTDVVVPNSTTNPIGGLSKTVASEVKVLLENNDIKSAVKVMEQASASQIAKPTNTTDMKKVETANTVLKNIDVKVEGVKVESNVTDNNTESNTTEAKTEETIKNNQTEKIPVKAN